MYKYRLCVYECVPTNPVSHKTQAGLEQPANATLLLFCYRSRSSQQELQKREREREEKSVSNVQMHRHKQATTGTGMSSRIVRLVPRAYVQKAGYLYIILP